MPPVREYFYTADARGNLYHDATLQNDKAFLNFFFRRLRLNDTGIHPEHGFVSPCGPEMNYIEAPGTPVVFRAIVDSAFVYGGDLNEPVDARRIRYGPDDQLYHPLSSGLMGRISPELLLCISSYMQYAEGQWILLEGGPIPVQGAAVCVAELEKEEARLFALPGPS
jgi:hypothetical protein